MLEPRHTRARRSRRERRPRTFALGALLFLAALLLGCGGGRANAPPTHRSSTDPSALAAAIDRAQATIDDPSASLRRLRTSARSQQLALRQLADRPGLRRPTFARLSPAARAAVGVALRASDALSGIVPRERRFPSWRIVSPPAPRELLGYFHAAATAYGIPWSYLAAIELVETRMGRIHGLSPAGARGPMQFMPSTWAEYGHGSIDGQRNSIMAAARFLAANGGRTKIGGALFHYNPSKAYVTAVESYAQEMRRNTRAFYGYYFWQVFYRTSKGTFVLPVGYPRARPVRLPG